MLSKMTNQLFDSLITECKKKDNMDKLKFIFISFSKQKGFKKKLIENTILLGTKILNMFSTTAPLYHAMCCT